MALVHVYPAEDVREHITKGRCWCEPSIMDLGEDHLKKPARVFVHQKIKEISK